MNKPRFSWMDLITAIVLSFAAAMIITAVGYWVRDTKSEIIDKTFAIGGNQNAFIKVSGIDFVQQKVVGCVYATKGSVALDHDYGFIEYTLNNVTRPIIPEIKVRNKAWRINITDSMHCVHHP